MGLKFSLDDTIAAISTGLGESGIGIVRLSGNKAIEIVDKIFIGKKRLKELPSHTLTYGKIINPKTKELVDEVLVSVMRKPKTYTREDVVEINCHGGIIPLKLVLKLVIENGARLAEPGEFTLRAFLNGRIDLTQAEAVNQLIKSKTELACKYHSLQLVGKLKDKIDWFKEELLNILAEVEADIDFPEEDLSIIPKSLMLKKLNLLKEEINKLINSYEFGKILSQGVVGVIVGRPNVGKSSIMNRLLGEDRVIVSKYPGTTRDTIAEYINIEGIPLKIVDTAGLRDVIDIDEIERESIIRTKKAIEKADIVIFVIDGSEALNSQDLKILHELKDSLKKIIIVVNKVDLPLRLDVDYLKKVFNNINIIKVSARKNIGLDVLSKKIKEFFLFSEVGSINSDELIITNIRHKEILQQISENIDNALRLLVDNNRKGEGYIPVELVAYELNSALAELARLTGEDYTELVLDKIFSTFCIGK